MATRRYLLVESRGEHESPDVGNLFDLGDRLRARGSPVVVFLIQNAVLGLSAGSVTDLLDRGVEVWADEDSIVSRGLDPGRQPRGVRLGGMPDLVRMLMAGDTVPVWH